MIRAVITAAVMAAALVAGVGPSAPSAASAAASPSTGQVGAGTSGAGSSGAGHARVGSSGAGSSGAPVGSDRGRTRLTLTYAAESGRAETVVLTCYPSGGLHPNPIQACATLASVGGRPDDLQPARRMCMMIYLPVTAKIAGNWRGRRLSWSKTYSNACDMNRSTGVLFQF